MLSVKNIRTRQFSLLKNIKFYYTESNDIKKLRNIGILAHIDAGKTTTTERMLFYSGKLQTMGEVHHGNTVTDYLDQERERGITITSAAVTFPWRDHTFNLIDTPGHIDFTMEVEQTLNVLDGAIVVLDGLAGVEAQTVTVWKQADRYKIPRIIYCNKMDRIGADVHTCCSSIESKLDVPSLLLQLPIKDKEKLVGVVNITSLEKILWSSSERGKVVKRLKLSEKEDRSLWEKAQRLRSSLIDKLSDTDDKLADLIIKVGSMDNISAETLAGSLRRTTLARKGVPVLCGSSYKNIGVQTLMDSVILYLPSPDERNEQYSCFEDNLCARAFKVVHNHQRGPLVFFRVYSGKMTNGQKLYNAHQDITEHTGKLLLAYADEFQEVNEVTNGNIAVLSHLKKTMTGDLITSSATAFAAAKKKLAEKNKKFEVISERNVNKIFDIESAIPDPVFFCSIEPPSLVYQKPLEKALKELEREDPSLRVKYSEETGQIVLSGMGELHLDIIKERIRKKYKIDVMLGPLQIAYKEAPCDKATVENTYETTIGNVKHHVHTKITVEPSEDKTKDVLKLDKNPDYASHLAKLYHKHLMAAKQGVEVALNHGPKIGCPLIGMSVKLHFLVVGKGTSETVISAAITQTVQKALKAACTKILEPVMQLEVITSDQYLSSVLADLSRRRSIIEHIDVKGKYKVVRTLTPLATVMDYSRTLRTLTSGTAIFNLEFSSYEPMSSADENDAIKSVQGF